MDLDSSALGDSRSCAERGGACGAVTYEQLLAVRNAVSQKVESIEFKLGRVIESLKPGELGRPKHASFVPSTNVRHVDDLEHAAAELPSLLYLLDSTLQSVAAAAFAVPAVARTLDSTAELLADRVKSLERRLLESEAVMQTQRQQLQQRKKIFDAVRGSLLREVHVLKQRCMEPEHIPAFCLYNIIDVLENTQEVETAAEKVREEMRKELQQQQERHDESLGALRSEHNVQMLSVCESVKELERCGSLHGDAQSTAHSRSSFREDTKLEELRGHLHLEMARRFETEKEMKRVQRANTQLRESLLEVERDGAAVRNGFEDQIAELQKLLEEREASVLQSAEDAHIHGDVATASVSPKGGKALQARMRGPSKRKSQRGTSLQTSRIDGPSSHCRSPVGGPPATAGAEKLLSSLAVGVSALDAVEGEQAQTRDERCAAVVSSAAAQTEACSLHDQATSTHSESGGDDVRDRSHFQKVAEAGVQCGFDVTDGEVQPQRVAEGVELLVCERCLEREREAAIATLHSSIRFSSTSTMTDSSPFSPHEAQCDGQVGDAHSVPDAASVISDDFVKTNNHVPLEGARGKQIDPVATPFPSPTRGSIEFGGMSRPLRGEGLAGALLCSGATSDVRELIEQAIASAVVGEGSEHLNLVVFRELKDEASGDLVMVVLHGCCIRAMWKIVVLMMTAGLCIAASIDRMRPQSSAWVGKPSRSRVLSQDGICRSLTLLEVAVTQLDACRKPVIVCVAHGLNRHDPSWVSFEHQTKRLPWGVIVDYTGLSIQRGDELHVIVKTLSRVPLAIAKGTVDVLVAMVRSVASSDTVVQSLAHPLFDWSLRAHSDAALFGDEPSHPVLWISGVETSQQDSLIAYLASREEMSSFVMIGSDSTSFVIILGCLTDGAHAAAGLLSWQATLPPHERPPLRCVMWRMCVAESLAQAVNDPSFRSCSPLLGIELALQESVVAAMSKLTIFSRNRATCALLFLPSVDHVAFMSEFECAISTLPNTSSWVHMGVPLDSQFHGCFAIAFRGSRLVALPATAPAEPNLGVIPGFHVRAPEALCLSVLQGEQCYFARLRVAPQPTPGSSSTNHCRLMLCASTSIVLIAKWAERAGVLIPSTASSKQQACDIIVACSSQSYLAALCWATVNLMSIRFAVDVSASLSTTSMRLRLHHFAFDSARGRFTVREKFSAAFGPPTAAPVSDGIAEDVFSSTQQSVTSGKTRAAAVDVWSSSFSGPHDDTGEPRDTHSVSVCHIDWKTGLTQPFAALDTFVVCATLRRDLQDCAAPAQHFLRIAAATEFHEVVHLAGFVGCSPDEQSKKTGSLQVLFSFASSGTHLWNFLESTLVTRAVVDWYPVITSSCLEGGIVGLGAPYFGVVRSLSLQINEPNGKFFTHRAYANTRRNRCVSFTARSLGTMLPYSSTLHDSVVVWALERRTDCSSLSLLHSDANLRGDAGPPRDTRMIVESPLLIADDPDDVALLAAAPIPWPLMEYGCHLVAGSDSAAAAAPETVLCAVLPRALETQFLEKVSVMRDFLVLHNNISTFTMSTSSRCTPVAHSGHLSEEPPEVFASVTLLCRVEAADAALARLSSVEGIEGLVFACAGRVHFSVGPGCAAKLFGSPTTGFRCCCFITRCIEDPALRVRFFDAWKACDGALVLTRESPSGDDGNWIFNLPDGPVYARAAFQRSHKGGKASSTPATPISSRFRRFVACPSAHLPLSIVGSSQPRAYVVGIAFLHWEALVSEFTSRSSILSAAFAIVLATMGAHNGVLQKGTNTSERGQLLVEFENAGSAFDFALDVTDELCGFTWPEELLQHPQLGAVVTRERAIFGTRGAVGGFKAPGVVLLRGPRVSTFIVPTRENDVASSLAADIAKHHVAPGTVAFLDRDAALIEQAASRAHSRRLSSTRRSSGGSIMMSESGIVSSARLLCFTPQHRPRATIREEIGAAGRVFAYPSNDNERALLEAPGDERLLRNAFISVCCGDGEKARLAARVAAESFASSMLLSLSKDDKTLLLVVAVCSESALSSTMISDFLHELSFSEYVAGRGDVLMRRSGNFMTSILSGPSVWDLVAGVLHETEALLPESSMLRSAASTARTSVIQTLGALPGAKLWLQLPRSPVFASTAEETLQWAAGDASHGHVNSTELLVLIIAWSRRASVVLPDAGGGYFHRAGEFQCMLELPDVATAILANLESRAFGFMAGDVQAARFLWDRILHHGENAGKIWGVAARGAIVESRSMCSGIAVWSGAAVLRAASVLAAIVDTDQPFVFADRASSVGEPQRAPLQVDLNCTHEISVLCTAEVETAACDKVMPMLLWIAACGAARIFKTCHVPAAGAEVAKNTVEMGFSSREKFYAFCADVAHLSDIYASSRELSFRVTLATSTLPTDQALLWQNDPQTGILVPSVRLSQPGSLSEDGGVPFLDIVQAPAGDESATEETQKLCSSSGGAYASQATVAPSVSPVGLQQVPRRHGAERSPVSPIAVGVSRSELSETAGIVAETSTEKMSRVAAKLSQQDSTACQITADPRVLTGQSPAGVPRLPSCSGKDNDGCTTPVSLLKRDAACGTHRTIVVSSGTNTVAWTASSARQFCDVACDTAEAPMDEPAAHKGPGGSTPPTPDPNNDAVMSRIASERWISGICADTSSSTSKSFLPVAEERPRPQPRRPEHGRAATAAQRSYLQVQQQDRSPRPSQPRCDSNTGTFSLVDTASVVRAKRVPMAPPVAEVVVLCCEDHVAGSGRGPVSQHLRGVHRPSSSSHAAHPLPSAVWRSRSGGASLPRHEYAKGYVQHEALQQHSNAPLALNVSPIRCKSPTVE